MLFGIFFIILLFIFYYLLFIHSSSKIIVKHVGQQTVFQCAIEINKSFQFVEQKLNPPMLHLKNVAIMIFYLISSQMNKKKEYVHLGASSICIRGTDDTQDIPKSLSNSAKLQLLL